MHLHLHSQYSVIDGMGTIEEYVKLAKADGQESIALTDHGTLGGAIDLYTTARKVGIKPIIGMELYVDAIELRERNYPGHLTVLAKNEDGYRALIAANNLAHRQFYYRPRLTLQQIIENKFARDWVILSGCQSSPIYKYPQSDSAIIAKALRDNCANFYLEFMYHNSKDKEFDDKQWTYLDRMADLHKITGIPMVITNDCHYAYASDEHTHQKLLARSTEASDLEFDGSDFYFKTTEEMQKIANGLGIPNAVDTAVEISRMCNVSIPEADKVSWYVPDITGGKPLETLEGLCRHKLGSLCALRGPEKAQEYIDRWNLELSVLKTSPAILNSYLVTHDVVTWCNSRGITVAARGSMAGSLVSFLLGITKEDPVKYRLSFSRAVNPARPTIPDFDLDCSSSHRGEVLEYLKKRYEGNIPIAAYTHFGPKGALRKILKMEGELDFQESLQVTKALPDDWTDGSFDYNGRQKKWVGNAEWQRNVPDRYKEEVALYHGKYSSMSVHPSGLIISGPERSIEHEIPLQWIASSKMLVSAFDMYTLKKTGMYKFDLLGLRTLDQLEYMERVSGATVPNDDYDEPEVLAAFGAGVLAEIFQMDGNACREVIRSINGVSHFEDIVAANTLARPGCAQFTRYYRSGYESLIREYPQLQDILGVTNGLILYQEQVMEIARILADFDDSEQDEVKEAIKYFQHDVWKNTIEVKFRARCEAKGIRPDNILEAISRMASYTFNRAHALTYSAIAYKMMWYKLHYPSVFYAAVFDDSDAKDDLIAESHGFDVEWSPPDINRSMSDTTLEGNTILLGLSAIKGIGPAVCEAVIEARPYVSEEDLLARVRRKTCNISHITKLKEGYALESVGVPGKAAAFKQSFGFPIGLLDGVKFKGLEQYNYWDKEHECWAITGFLTNVRTVTTKQQKEMAFVKVATPRGMRECILWPDIWEKSKNKIHSGAILSFASMPKDSKWEVLGVF